MTASSHRPRAGRAVLWLILGACTSAVQTQEDARERAAQDAAARLSAPELRLSRAGEETTIAAAVRALLAQPLTEESAMRLALLNHRGLRATMHGLGVPAAEWVQAGLLSNPMFSADAKIFDAGTEVEFGLSQSFLDVFYRPLRRTLAAAELAAAEARLTAEIVRVAFEARRAYLDLRAALALVALQESSLDAVDAARLLTEELHRAGNVTDPMLTAALAAHGQARLALAAAQAAAREAREPLHVLFGVWGADTEWILAEHPSLLAQDPAQDVDLRGVETRSVAVSLDLAAQRAAVERSAQRTGLTAWESWLPHAELGLAGKREAADGDWGFGPAVAFRLPLLDPGGTQRAAAGAALLRDLEVYAHTAIEVRSAARSFRERLIASGDATRFLREVQVPLIARLVLETLQNYNGMQIGVFEVLEAKEQELAARRAMLDTAREAWRARLDLEELLAGRLNRDRVAQRPQAGVIGAAASAHGSRGGHGE